MISEQVTESCVFLRGGSLRRFLPGDDYRRLVRDHGESVLFVIDPLIVRQCPVGIVILTRDQVSELYLVRGKPCLGRQVDQHLRSLVRPGAGQAGCSLRRIVGSGAQIHLVTVCGQACQHFVPDACGKACVAVARELFRDPPDDQFRDIRYRTDAAGITCPGAFGFRLCLCCRGNRLRQDLLLRAGMNRYIAACGDLGLMLRVPFKHAGAHILKHDIDREESAGLIPALALCRGSRHGGTAVRLQGNVIACMQLRPVYAHMRIVQQHTDRKRNGKISCRSSRVSRERTLRNGIDIAAGIDFRALVQIHRSLLHRGADREGREQRVAASGRHVRGHRGLQGDRRRGIFQLLCLPVRILPETCIQFTEDINHRVSDLHIDHIGQILQAREIQDAAHLMDICRCVDITGRVYLRVLPDRDRRVIDYIVEIRSRFLTELLQLIPVEELARCNGQVVSVLAGLRRKDQVVRDHGSQDLDLRAERQPVRMGYVYVHAGGIQVMDLDPLIIAGLIFVDHQLAQERVLRGDRQRIDL